MKKVLKVLSWVLLLSLVLGMVLTGCGSTVADTAKTDTTKEDTIKEDAPKADTNKEPVKMTFTYWGSPNEKAAIEKACKQFTENNPNITVEPINIPGGDYNAKMTAMAASNNSPDTGYMTGDTPIS